MFTPDVVKQSMQTTEQTVRNVLSEIFPIEGNRNVIRLIQLEMGSHPALFDFSKQKDIKLKGQSLAVPVHGEFELVDKSSGKVIDKQRVNLMRMPVLTPRGSFLVDGNEYQSVNQLRLRSGTYTRQRQSGEYETQVNTETGYNFRVTLDPEKGFFYIQVGTSNILLYPLLRGLGIQDTMIERHIGKELLETNRRNHEGKVLQEMRRFAKAYRLNPSTDDTKGIRDVIEGEFFKKTTMDPDTTKLTLGKGFETVNAELILLAAQKLHKVMQGESEEDDRDSLEFKKFLSFDDHISERLRALRTKITRRVNNNIDRANKVKELISPGDFNNPVKSFFTTSSLSSTTEQTNPLTMIGDYSKVTIMGEGGLENSQAVTNAMRDINPSTLGFLDPVHTPESEKIGALLHLTQQAVKRGDTLAIEVYEAKTGAIKEITPKDLVVSTVAFPGQYDPKTKKFKSNDVKAIQRKKTTTVKPSEVDYVITSSRSMFDTATNMIPFLHNDQGNRAMMASKMQEQALPLKNREAPLVQSSVQGDITYEQILGDSQVLKSPEDGTITSLEPLRIRTKTGKIIDVAKYSNFPLAEGSFADHSLDPTLKVGSKVKKNQRLADSNFTKDGQFSLGSNLKVAFMPYKGLTFEDGVVISEDTAKKMTSEHLYTESFEKTDDHNLDVRRFRQFAPVEATPDRMQNLDERGVVKKGSKVKPGDILVAAVRRTHDTEEERMRRALSKKLKRDWRSDALTWEKDVTGTVIDVVEHGRRFKITIRTEEPARVGDKLVGRHGNKGTISKIIPMGEMPKDENDDPIDMIINPMAVPSRMNIGQILESNASLIAQKTGKPFVVDNFSDKDYLKDIRAQMKKLGIKEKQKVTDPTVGELDNPVFVGNQYILKLQHQTGKKFSARGIGGYTMDEQPTRGGKNSGQALDALTNYTMLAHGAKENLRESAVIKGQRNDEFWRAFRAGERPPKPKQPFVFDKFINNLQALGVKVDKQDEQFQLMAMTDKDIDKMSSGKVEDALLVTAPDLKPEKGGLLDLKVTGGITGDKWSHMELSEPIPNPIFEPAVRSLLDLTEKEFDSVLGGEKKIDGKTGGHALEHALSKIDVKKELKEANELTTSGKVRSKQRLDGVHKRIRFLNALDKTERKPTDYILHKVPILPPKFRPIYPMEDGSLNVSDVNELYQHVGLLNQSLDYDKDSFLLDDKGKGATRTELYNAMSAMQGLSEPITFDARNRKRRGIIKQIGGDSAAGLQPKNAYFQDKVIRRRQDLSGRAVIGPGPDLDVDEAGIPREMAWSVFENHIIRDMVQNQGMKTSQARQEVEKRTKTAERTMQRVADTTPVILNRAPSLHKFSTMAFKPKLIDGKTIQIPSLVTKGFNADYDGDSMALHVPVSESAKKEAFDKMLPSKNLFRPGFGSFMLEPSQEQILGLYFLTKEPKVGRPLQGNFATEREALEAFAKRKDKNWRTDDPITLRGQRVTIGKVKANAALPRQVQNYKDRFDKKFLKTLFEDMKEKKVSESDIVRAASKLKDLGNQYSYQTGFTVSLGDIDIDKTSKNNIFQAADKKLGKNPSLERFTEVYSQAEKELEESIKKENPDNAFTHMATSGARGNMGNMRQILGAPVMMMDNQNKVVPVAVKRSYSEGLDTGDYWITMFGARKGMVDRARSTAEPGAFTKVLINNTLDHLVTEKDCGTQKGIVKNIDDMFVHDRYLAKDVMGIGRRNERVTKSMLRELKRAKVQRVEVRSPLHCEAKEGVCAKCYGVMPDGKEPSVGDNIGVIAGHTLTEPTTQMAMDSFHTGGIASHEMQKAQGLNRLSQLFEMPEKLPNKATLSTVDGRVSKIERKPSGGMDVHVNQTTHFVGLGRKPIVKVGDQVQRGDQLSDGVVRPQDLLETQGMDAVRNYMTKELSEAYKHDIHHNALETVVQKITNLTQVNDPGNSEEVSPGEFAPLNKIERLNREGANIKHTPQLKSVKQLQHYALDDWMARMNFTHLKRSIQDGAQEAQASKFKNTNHPIPAFAYGLDFGTTPNKY